nr:GDCCVxC domain-containing (seleno)protein [Vibrio sp. Isolate23]
MPDNTSVYFYECKSCGELLKPLPGDCCVFCSYGTSDNAQQGLLICTMSKNHLSAQFHSLQESGY